MNCGINGILNAPEVVKRVALDSRWRIEKSGNLISKVGELYLQLRREIV